MNDKNYISKKIDSYKSKMVGLVAGITTFILLSAPYCDKCVEKAHYSRNQNSIDSTVVEADSLGVDSLNSLKSDLGLKPGELKKVERLESKIESYNK